MKNIDFTEDKSLIQSSDVLESEDTISECNEINVGFRLFVRELN